MKKIRRMLLPLLVLALVLAVWWILRGPRGDGSSLAASGTVEATEADLGFQVPGRIAGIEVHEGDQAAAGQVLATLDLSEMEARRTAAQGQLEAATARLAELESGSRPEEIAQAEAAARAARERLEQAERDLDRARRLQEGGAVSREALERAETAREVASADLEQAQERLELVRKGPRSEQVRAQRALVLQARGALDQVEAAIGNGTIVAPFDGRVAQRHREPGEVVGAGTPVLTLRDLSDRWVRIYVREDAVGRVRIGQAARITTDSYPGRSYEGRVFFIGSEAEFTPRNVQTSEERTRLVYPVKVRITADEDVDLKPGIPADVVLEEPEG